MATMNISLPDKMKEWVESQVATGQYANASDFVRDLMRDKYEHQMKIDRLNQLLQEGLDSGVSDKSFDEILQESKRRAREKGLID